jgi:hypothetical protein
MSIFTICTLRHERWKNDCNVVLETQTQHFANMTGGKIQYHCIYGRLGYLILWGVEMQLTS